MALQNQTGIFFMDASSDVAIKPFPGKFNSRLFTQLDRPFLTILAVATVILFSLFFILSLRPVSDTMSEKEVLKIQERYAQLVLNKPVKKKVEKVKTEDVSSEVKEEVEEDKPKVDRKNESVEQRQERKAASSEERKAKRAAISKELASAGIFAAITATGSGGGGAAVNDLLGDAAGLGDIGDIDISKGSFATRNVDAATLKARRGERVSGVGIKTEGVGTAGTQRLASSGSVKVTSAKPKIEGGSAGAGTRSMAAIGKVVAQQQSRLRKVYETMLKRDPSLGGRLEIKFTINEDGSVSNVSVIKSTTGNNAFDNRIVSYIKRWKFAAASGGPVEVVYPFVFSGS